MSFFFSFFPILQILAFTLPTKQLFSNVNVPRRAEWLMLGKLGSAGTNAISADMERLFVPGSNDSPLYVSHRNLVSVFLCRQFSNRKIALCSKNYWRFPCFRKTTNFIFFPCRGINLILFFLRKLSALINIMYFKIWKDFFVIIWQEW